MSRRHHDLRRNGRIEDEYNSSRIVSVSASEGGGAGGWGADGLMMTFEKKISALSMAMRATISDGTYLHTPCHITKIFGPCVSRESYFDIENSNASSSSSQKKRDKNHISDKSSPPSDPQAFASAVATAEETHSENKDINSTTKKRKGGRPPKKIQVDAASSSALPKKSKAGEKRKEKEKKTPKARLTTTPPRTKGRKLHDVQEDAERGGEQEKNVTSIDDASKIISDIHKIIYSVNHKLITGLNSKSIIIYDPNPTAVGASISTSVSSSRGKKRKIEEGN